MLDRLIDLLVSSLRLFVFWVVVDQYERGLVLRFGKYSRELEPGIHWVIPFGVERTMSEHVVPQTVNLGPQSLTTHDGRSVVICAVVTCRVVNVRQSLLDVEDVSHALRDACYAEVASVIRRKSWEEISHGDLGDALAEACHKRARRWGIEVMRVQLSDAALSRSLRLWQEHSGPVGHN